MRPGPIRVITRPCHLRGPAGSLRAPHLMLASPAAQLPDYFTGQQVEGEGELILPQPCLAASSDMPRGRSRQPKDAGVTVVSLPESQKGL